jgi:hypothetical protein
MGGSVTIRNDSFMGMMVGGAVESTLMRFCDIRHATLYDKAAALLQLQAAGREC